MRNKQKPEEIEYAAVLGGGGTKGAYQVGAWKAIKELGIKVNCIVGVSIGALNGAMFIQDEIEKSEELYNKIKITDVMDIDETVNAEKGIFNIANITKLTKEFAEQKGISNEPLRKTIEKYIDIDKIYKSKIDFGLLALDANERTPVEMYKKDIPKEQFVDYLLASSCFPIFKPQKIGDKEFLDGGLYDNMPINMLLKKNYKNILVFDIAGIGIKRKLLNKDVYLKVISPNESLGGTFEFNPEKIKSNIKLGYLDTLKVFNKVQGHIYYFNVKEFNKMMENYGLQTIYGLEHAAQIYNIDKLKIYKFEEFIEELRIKHVEAQTRYNKIKEILKSKNILEIKSQIKTIFDGDLGICFATDIYLDKPMSKKFEHLNHFTRDYTKCVKALLELT
ncbi:MAG TPA: patatin-like phospholipase family protein [Clostridia bacterium]|nr:patatin-like phospholipase family protein [Clostridia bacterium]